MTLKMRVNILSFGIAREIVGSSSISLDLNEESDSRQLRLLLDEKFPKLKQLSSYRLAINGQFALGEELIHETDEIALIPPVSGG